MPVGFVVVWYLVLFYVLCCSLLICACVFSCSCCDFGCDFRFRCCFDSDVLIWFVFCDFVDFCVLFASFIWVMGLFANVFLCLVYLVPLLFIFFGLI